MLYLYTIMMFAWDLDKDTHAYFRRYLDIFINKRKISKDVKGFVREAQERQQLADGQVRPALKEIATRYRVQFNGLRINLPNRISRLIFPPLDPGWIIYEELSIQGSLDLIPLQGGRIKHLKPTDEWPQMLLPRHQNTSSLIDSIHPSKRVLKDM